MRLNEAIPKEYIQATQFGAAKSWNRKVSHHKSAVVTSTTCKRLFLNH